MSLFPGLLDLHLVASDLGVVADLYVLRRHWFLVERLDGIGGVVFVRSNTIWLGSYQFL